MTQSEFTIGIIALFVFYLIIRGCMALYDLLRGRLQ